MNTEPHESMIRTLRIARIIFTIVGAIFVAVTVWLMTGGDANTFLAANMSLIGGVSAFGLAYITALFLRDIKKGTNQ